VLKVITAVIFIVFVVLYGVSSIKSGSNVLYQSSKAESLPEKRKQKSIEENAKEISEDTTGHPIMVKFTVVGKGLREDVDDRYGRYLLVDANR
jgi:hypothetical protein